MPDCTEYDLIIKDLQKNRQHFSFISHVDAWWTMKTILDWAVRWWESWPDQKFWSAVMKLKQSQNTCTHAHELVRLFWMEFLKRQNCLRLVFVSHHGILIDFFFCMVWADKLLFHLCEKWFHFHACTFSVTQQQVRTKLCSSDSSTFSSPSSSSPVPLCPIRELMAFPMSQNEGGTSATNSHEACVEKIKPH